MVKKLISDGYKNTLTRTHLLERWGSSGSSWALPVLEFVEELKIESILDYGCGTGTLSERLSEIGFTGKIQNYDPGISLFDISPTNADLVVCTDVLEHIEEKFVDNNLKTIFDLSNKAAFFHINCALSKRNLADGRNSHITIKSPGDWERLIKAYGWNKTTILTHKKFKITMICYK